MTLTPISPLKAQSLGGDGARLVDIRSPEEFAFNNVPGAENRPLATIEPFEDARDVVFICRTGRRSEMNAPELAALTKGKAYRLDGGIVGWRAAGLPLAVDRSGALELDQQALIVSGALVIVSALFAVIVTGWYFLLAVAVGADLIYRGRTERSVIEKALRLFPWNRGK
ncbi:rhodanese-like domain-containing protein [Qipengyuania oceanensis]|uniref:Rhodanese domain-containing protein n=1 Tax=Qipengyuania oceanensis TaxID=1463597 RepID=A0A844YHM6_9SPHN|nr:rhodanese-like domain-containing protein [Qipengyuania oceanensis]MXO63223.1 hypothetical protein [Qipengyuania oceanensis]